MSATRYCWWCHKQRPDSELRLEWCPDCMHQLGIPPADCQCLMCQGKIPPRGMIAFPTPVPPEMPVTVDVEQWVKFLRESYRGVLVDYHLTTGAGYGMITTLAKLAALAISDKDHVTRNVEALEVMADLSEFFLDDDDDDES